MAHIPKCVNGKAKFHFHTLQHVWAEHLPVDQSRPELGSWLSSSVTNGMGCTVCRAYGLTDGFATFSIRRRSSMQLVHLRKHGLSRKHAVAVARFLGKEMHPGPTAYQFKKVWDHCIGGGHSGEFEMLLITRR